MVIEFQVGNYRSFKEIVTFSMVASSLKSKDSNIDQNNTFAVDSNLTILKSAAIYGANASGKSNLIEAMEFMRSFVKNSSKETQTGESIDVEPFRLSQDTIGKPSFFQMVFILEGRKYRYGFEVTPQRIVSEWLFHVPTIKEAKLFVRDENGFSISKTGFKEAKGISDKTRDNALFLSVVAQFNGDISKKIIKWFKMLRVYTGIYAFQRNYRYTVSLLKNPKYSGPINTFLKNLDLGFDKIEVEENSSPLLPRELTGDVPEELKSVNAKLKEVMQELITMGMPDKYSFLELKTAHPIYNSAGQRVSNDLFDLEVHESEGTRKIISLSGSIIDTLINGKVLIMDELDRSLHPLLTLSLIELFNSSETNPNNAQLIFATHDTNLLSNKLFRRDQIWFTEKDKYGSTHLYSLVEFNVRNDAILKNFYTQGKFGAIPFIGNLQSLIGE